MDLAPEKLMTAAGGVLLLVVGFLGRWVWERYWKKKDETSSRENSKLSSLELRMNAVEVRETERARHVGVLESNQNRLDGKVDALQTFWRTEFAKMGEQFQKFEEKVEYRLDNLRLELRGDQQKTEERLTGLFTAHQTRMHDRLNVIAADQARLLTEFVDGMVRNVGEPRPSPAQPPGGTPP